MSSAKWFMETRPQFLLLSVVLVGHHAGVVAGSFSWAHVVGASRLLMHASVNVLNDWHDYSRTALTSGRRTPFSGGSGLRQQAS